MLFLKILRILNGIFVISVALSAAARIFPIFRLAASLHQLYTLEMYQRDARLRKMKKSMLRMKRRIDRLERRIGGDGDV